MQSTALVLIQLTVQALVKIELVFLPALPALLLLLLPPGYPPPSLLALPLSPSSFSP